MLRVRPKLGNEVPKEPARHWPLGQEAELSLPRVFESRDVIL